MKINNTEKSEDLKKTNEKLLQENKKIERQKNELLTAIRK